MVIYACYHGLMRMNRLEFEHIVEEAVDALPSMCLRHLDNVEVVIAERPAPAQRVGLSVRRSQELLGLYEGTPLTERGVDHGMVAPDRITLFRPAILAICGDLASVRDEIRRTLRHELAHHFGIDDDRLEEIGAY